MVVVGLGLSVFCLAGWCLLVGSSFCGGAFPVALHARCCLGRVKRGRETRHLPPHFLIYYHGCFLGPAGGDRYPVCCPAR